PSLPQKATAPAREGEESDDAEARRPACAGHPCQDTGRIRARPSVAVTLCKMSPHRRTVDGNPRFSPKPPSPAVESEQDRPAVRGRNMRIHLAGASLLTIAICSPALAQDQPAATEPTDLDAIVITDGLTSVDLRKSGRAVTVITGEQIEKNHIR